MVLKGLRPFPLPFKGEFKRGEASLNITTSPSLMKGGGYKGAGYLIKIQRVRGW